MSDERKPVSPQKPVLIENAGPIAKLDVEEGTEAKITLIKIGDKEKGWIPPKKMLDEFKLQLEEAIKQAKAGEPVPRIITHAFVDIETIDITSNGQVLIMNDGETKVRTPPFSQPSLFARILDWPRRMLRRIKLRSQIP